MDGRIEQRQIDRLKEVGEWMKKYGESIYGTRGGPYKPQRWIASTHKGNKIYIHLLQWPDGNLKLPVLKGIKIIHAVLLGGKELEWNQEKAEVIIRLPEKPVDPDDTVLVIEINKSLDSFTPIDVPEHMLTE